MTTLKEMKIHASHMRTPTCFLTTGPDGFTLHLYNAAEVDRYGEGARVYDLTTARGEIRIFSKIETAIKTAQSIGAFKLEITLGGIK